MATNLVAAADQTAAPAAREGAETVTLRDGQGMEHTVRKDTIEDRTKLPTTLMPEGLVSDLTVGQFASLLDFIESIGK